MKIFLTVFAFLFACSSHAQFTPAWLSTYNGDGDYSDHFTCVTEGESGNVYAAGYTHKTDNNADFLVCKFNSSGALVWSRSWRGSGQGPDIAYAVVFHNNTLYAAGEVSNSGFGFDFFTIAVSTSGDSIWGAHYNDATYNQYDQANAICVDNSGNIIVAGESDRDPSSVINDDFLTVKYSSAGALLWAKRYNHTGNATDRAVAVAADAQGNINVAGRVNNGGDDDYAVLQYNAAGTLNWSQFFDNGGLDRAADMGIDGAGNVYVTGRSNNGNDDDYRTLKYSPAGILQFNVAYDFVDDDRADFIDVASNGTFAIAGRSDGSAAPIVNYNYRVVKYAADGAQLWTNTYEGAGANDDIVQDVDITETGEVMVTGYSDANASALIQNNIVSIKYGANGTAAWTNIYSGSALLDDEAGAGMIDSQGKAWILGHSEGTTAQRDAIALLYDAQGNVLANTVWSGPGDNSDNVREIARDNAGNLFVCGYSVGKDTDRDMFLMKMNSAGDTLWTRSVSGTLFGSDEEANSIAIDNTGNVIIGGYTKNSGTGSDITLLKYNSNGTLLWTAQYNSNANESDRGYDIATDATGNIYITGKTDIDPSPIVTNDEIFTAKYTANGALAWSVVNNGGPGYQRGRSIAVASSGSIYVCGQTFNGTDEDILVAKYNTAGTQVWQYIYDSGQFDLFKESVLMWDESIALTASKTTGPLNAQQSQLMTMRIGSGGQLAWESSFVGNSGFSSQAECIAVSMTGNLVVLGSEFIAAQPAGTFNAITVCYSPEGTQLWDFFDNWSVGQDDIGDALAIDANNNIYVATHSNVGDEANVHYITRISIYDANAIFIDGGTIDESDTLNVCNKMLLTNESLIVAGSRWSPDGQRDMLIANYGITLATPEFSGNVLSLYPNPASTEVRMTVEPQWVGATYRVIDMFGKTITTGRIDAVSTTFDCSTLAQGCYTIVVGDPSNTFQSTFIKQ